MTIQLGGSAGYALPVMAGAPLPTEVPRYGWRATAIGIPAPAELSTEVRLRFVGPAAFGYDVGGSPLPGSYANRNAVSQ